MSLKRCQDCKTDFRDQDAKHFGHCPNCDSGFFTVAPSEDAPNTVSKKKRTEAPQPGIPPAGVTDIDKLIAAQQETTRSLIAAQTKTTHAVRSLAITLVAAPIISIAIILAVVLASASGNTALIVFTGILGVIVVIATMVASLNELTKSKIY